MKLSHQLKAVAMMVEREWAGLESCQFPSIWETTRFSERSKRCVLSVAGSQIPIMRRRYRNSITGVYSEYAAPSTGGLLADVRFPNDSLHYRRIYLWY
jgi:hypothetical protein